MGISLNATVSSKLGLASHQNAVPLLRQLTITNDGDEALEDLIVAFDPSLPFAEAKSWRIDRLDAESAVDLPDRDIELKEGFLAELSESIRSSVHFCVRSASAELAEQHVDIELLARNDWGGAGSMPELLPVFCTPNDPAVDRVLKAASDVLRRAGRPDGIDGYEARSRQRAWELTAAFWSAVCGYQISYALPPASFAQNGQKIRTPSQVLEGRVGTCLDTALLFASALEQAGLNSLVILTKGHAFTGVWLQPQEFAQILIEDASAVRKRVELQELIVFETTLATHIPSPGFSQAIDAAKRELTDHDFVMAVDIRRARMQKLRPLSVALQQGAATQEQDAPCSSEGLEAAPQLPSFDVEVSEESSTPKDKLELWQRRLLDLTTRNRLLHLPESAKAIRLVCPDPGGLEDTLADNKSVRIVPMPNIEVGGRDSRIYQQRTHQDLEREVALQAMARREVPCRLEKVRLDAALVELYRKAKTDLEEGGSNTLFLAIGFLHWKKAESDPRIYNAPLILLPVKLERRSVVSGVKLSMLDEEPRFNLTLLELLRHDFQLDIHRLDGELPTDAHGINVPAIWDIVRHAVRDMPGFEVTTDVVLGTFSFAKYLMWRDLVDRSRQLMQNDVVRHLLLHRSGQSSLTTPESFPDPAKLDVQMEPRGLFAPLPADSSQLAAVVASANGHSFVLDGPPGTGKSQTIANMIAHNLALGRRVLFVAEKMAALDVVKRRLEENGIGQFCVELHSSKSSKMHLLKQLDRAWTERDTLVEADWEAQAARVRGLRDELNQFVSVLHKRWPNGLSVYEAIGRVVHDADFSNLRLSWPDGTVHDAAQLARLRDVARRLDLNYRAVAHIGADQLELVAQKDWSNAWQADMVASARQALAAIKACDDACAEVGRATGLSIKASTATAGKLLDLVRLFPDACGVDLNFAFSPELPRIRAAAQQAMAHLKEYEDLERRLSQGYAHESIRHIDTDKLQREWHDASGKFWILSTFSKKKIAKALGEAAITPSPPDVEADLPQLIAMKAVVAKTDGLDQTLHAIPGWDGLRSNATKMAFAIKLAEGLRAGLISLAGSPEELMTLRREVQRLVVEGNDLLARGAAVAMVIDKLKQGYASTLDAVAQFAKAAGTEIDICTQTKVLRASANAVVAHEAALKAWCSWRRIREEARGENLEPLVDAIESGTIPRESVSGAFEVAYARWFASGAIDKEPLLCRFVPAVHQNDIEAFGKAVDKLSNLTSRYIRAKLSGSIPDKGDVTNRSGFGVLKHELQKQRRHKPVRQLAQEMGRDFAALTPCMLMSPLSIAQFLPADHELFDLVIFDEASQIAPWDAVGSIARGKQVVIAGDPKQMPPTSFFNRGANAGDDDVDEDLESILDECLGAGVPQHSLTWHYRSRHESLIAFSNHAYYGDSLITFPAADTRPSAVSWRKVEGVYAPGAGGRRNQLEAKAIVAEVVRRLTDAAFVRSGQSIGIITLNAEQQQLIDDLLDQARRNHREIETFFDPELPEPVIVKNLETMQGDERDLIILGIGFGPTEPEQKTMSMNFGPLNRDGGWRRLNVAVTRARREMMIFTSFDSSMIDLSRTSARAVEDLRHFIEFAEQGPKAIAAAVHGSLGGHESPFEAFVADGLRRKGWNTHPQIGVSRFRIDLGVVHPDRPGDYLVGVECDGATYHSAATARDRDKIRAEILRGLGWRLLRVWSTEWWVDREGALDRLDQAVRAILEESRDKAAELKRSREIEAAEPVITEEEGFEIPTHAEDALPVDAAVPARGEASSAEVAEPVPVQRVAHISSQLTVPMRRLYRKAELSSLKPSLRPADFHDHSYDATLGELVRVVVEAEAPILDKVLVDRIARAHGFKRSGHLIRERVLEIAERHYFVQPNSDPDAGSFIWLSPDDPDRWNTFRVPGSEEDVRFIDEIPREELLAAARSVENGDAPSEIAKEFGIRRLSSAARARILEASQTQLID